MLGERGVYLWREGEFGGLCSTRRVNGGQRRRPRMGHFLKKKQPEGNWTSSAAEHEIKVSCQYRSSPSSLPVALSGFINDLSHSIWGPELYRLIKKPFSKQCHEGADKEIRKPAFLFPKLCFKSFSHLKISSIVSGTRWSSQNFPKHRWKWVYNTQEHSRSQGLGVLSWCICFWRLFHRSKSNHVLTLRISSTQWASFDKAWKGDEWNTV